MSSLLDKRVTVKLFAGFVIHPDMRREMFVSDKWHMAETAWKSQENGLQIARHEGKEYVGKYLDSVSLTIEEIKDKELKIGRQLIHHCPGVNQFPLKFFIFPQTFVT